MRFLAVCLGVTAFFALGCSGETSELEEPAPQPSEEKGPREGKAKGDAEGKAGKGKKGG